MVEVQNHHYPARAAQQSLTLELLQPLLVKRRPERVLILKHESAADLVLQPVSPVQIVRLSTDATAADAVVRCRLGPLPFEQASFDLVVLQQLVSDGSAQVLQAALRVLAAGGDLVICGLNSAGLQFRIRNRQDQFPGLRINRIIKYLQAESFNIVQCPRMGLAGLSRPVFKGRQSGGSWYGLAMPFADYIVVHGHHHSTSENTRILRLKQTRRASVSPAALDGISSRKAAS